MRRGAKCKPTMTELLREAIAKAPTLLAIERATGVRRSAIRRFRDGKQSLRLDIADKLAAYFGIECRRVKRKG
jgi:plasmid maintenance system antidote protein VapI